MTSSTQRYFQIVGRLLNQLLVSVRPWKTGRQGQGGYGQSTTYLRNHWTPRKILGAKPTGSVTNLVILEITGGRFTVLTPVGLLPIAAVRYIQAMMEGAAAMAEYSGRFSKQNLLLPICGDP